jgi:peptidoglycan/LPS O-acetylase OafA/YrhL
MEYRADIDGLRALAVLLVLVFHFDLLGLGAGGFIGVDLFFVISGYLISTIVWRALDEQRFSLGHFYAQRIRRLAPALVTVQLVVFIGAFVSLLPGEVLGFIKESVFAQLYVSNLYYWQSLNYFGGRADSQFLLHTWSLGVEEQFYLFYPFFLIAVHRFAPKRIVPVLIVATLLSFALNVLLVETKPEAAFYLLPMRAWEMLAGALLARGQARLMELGWLRMVAGPVALLLIAIALAIYGPATLFPGWFALLPVGAGVLLILAGMGPGSAVSRLLALPLPVWIGRISYPLYLVHWPIHIFALILLPHDGLAERWAMFGLSFLCAQAIYRWVERPLRGGAWLQPDRRLFAIYLAALAVIMAIAGSAWATDGWRFRFSPHALQVADVSGAYDPAEVPLDYPGGPVEPWLRPIGQAGPPAWLIFGDSHAGALAQASSLWLGQRGEAGVVGFHNSCMPLLDTGNASCREFNRAILSYGQRHPSIGAILLVSIWRQPTEPGFTDANGHIVSGDAAIRAFAAALHKTLIAWHSIGVKVYIWEPLPAMSRDVPGMMVRNMMFGDYLPISVPAADYTADFRFLDDAFNREAPLIAGRVPSARLMCAGGTCSAADHGLPLFEDNNHPAFVRAPYFAEILRQSMLGVAPVRGRIR